MSDNDDALIGRLMSRREVLALFGVAGAAFVVGCSDDSESPTSSPTSTATKGATSAPTEGAVATATGASGGTSVPVPSCVVVPELTEGPYFVDEMLNRSDIRSEPTDNSVVAGDQLDIIVNVSQVGGDGSCTALAGAQVDVWHCDAVGVYSGASDPGFDTTGKTWLRGYQVTGDNGQVAFTTIYPGWYQGRATHIHFKIRTEDGYEFTSQWFFNDAFSDTVHTQGVYADRGATGRLQNSGDNIFGQSNGQLTLDVASAGTSAYATTFNIGLQLA